MIDPRPTVSESVFESMADRETQRRCMRDSRYRNAENAEEQAEAEEAIEAEVLTDLGERYRVA